MSAFGATPRNANKVVLSLLLIRIGMGIAGLAILAVLYYTK